MTRSALEKLCMGFKGATQDIKWGNDLCYSVGAKMFCVTSLQGSMSVSFKATPEEFGQLVEREGIIPAPYVAKHFWVLVQDVRALRPPEWKVFVQKSYELVFEKLPRKLKDSIQGPKR